MLLVGCNSATNEIDWWKDNARVIFSVYNFHDKSSNQTFLIMALLFCIQGCRATLHAPAWCQRLWIVKCIVIYNVHTTFQPIRFSQSMANCQHRIVISIRNNVLATCTFSLLAFHFFHIRFNTLYLVSSLVCMCECERMSVCVNGHFILFIYNTIRNASLCILSIFFFDALFISRWTLSVYTVCCIFSLKCL